MHLMIAVHDRVDNAMSVSGGQLHALPEHVRRCLNMHMAREARHEDAQHPLMRQFYDHWETRWDQLSRRTKRNYLINAIRYGHPHGAGAEMDTDIHFNNPYVIE